MGYSWDSREFKASSIFEQFSMTQGLLGIIKDVKEKCRLITSFLRGTVYSVTDKWNADGARNIFLQWQGHSTPYFKRHNQSSAASKESTCNNDQGPAKGWKPLVMIVEDDSACLIETNSPTSVSVSVFVSVRKVSSKGKQTNKSKPCGTFQAVEYTI